VSYPAYSLSPQFKGFLELCRRILPDRDDDTNFARTGEISSHLRCDGLSGRELPHANAFHSLKYAFRL
jgi:hypothetical protein